MAKAGKWAWLKDDPRFAALPPDPTYDEALGAVLDQYRALPPEDLAALINEREVEKAEREQALSETNLHLTALERALVAALEARGIDRLSVGGYTFTPKVEPMARVEGVEDFDAWVRETHPELLSVHHQRLQSLVKARLEANEALPPGVVVNVRTSLSRRKG